MTTDNMLKYANYKDQMEHLTRALDERFYLEAVFIEYAVIEDRLTSALKHAGVYNEKKHRMLTDKVKALRLLIRNGDKAACEHLLENLLDNILSWKDKRNSYVHSLMDQEQETDSFEELAQEGNALMQSLKNAVGTYNRAHDKAVEATKNMSLEEIRYNLQFMCNAIAAGEIPCEALSPAQKAVCDQAELELSRDSDSILVPFAGDDWQPSEQLIEMYRNLSEADATV